MMALITIDLSNIIEAFLIDRVLHIIIGVTQLLSLNTFFHDDKTK